MRGVYGKHRGVLIGADGVAREAALPSPFSQSALLEQAKVAAVLTLSAVAVIVAAKVLSPEGKPRRIY